MNAPPATIHCSIVLPVYYNEGSLATTLAALKERVMAVQPHKTFEVIFVDDGSGDGSFAELMRLRATDPQLVKVIKFTRNFGQVNALLAGLAHARGQTIVMMSADGQDPPELINDMLRAHEVEQYEIVICAREGRDESLYRVITSKIFYAVMRWLTFPNMPAGGFDYILLGRRAAQAVLTSRDAHPFLQGLVLWTGYKTKFIGYLRQNRQAGVSRWTFGKKLTYLIDGVLSYSYFPIRCISGAGIVCALLGFGYAAVVMGSKLVYGNPVKGWTPLMIVVLLIGGLQMLMLGIIGEYVWRTVSQVRNRSPYIIDAIYEEHEQETGEGQHGERVHTELRR